VKERESLVESKPLFKRLILCQESVGKLNRGRKKKQLGSAEREREVGSTTDGASSRNQGLGGKVKKKKVKGFTTRKREAKKTIIRLPTTLVRSKGHGNAEIRKGQSRNSLHQSEEPSQKCLRPSTSPFDTRWQSARKQKIGRLLCTSTRIAKGPTPAGFKHKRNRIAAYTMPRNW